MAKIVSITTVSAYAVLVTSIILTCVELSHSCHRRVEYHHYYKKRPHKAYGHGGGPPQGHGGSHGGGYGSGHGGGGHHNGKAHGGGYGGGGHHGKAHGGGHGYGGGHHGKAHGGGHGYGGGHHSQGHGGGPSYGGGHPGHGGYGHMSGHGGHHGGVYGHSGGGHKGYGSGHEQGGYGGGHQEHGGYGEGHHEHGGYQPGDGYGHGHEQNAYGHGHDEGYGHPSGGGYAHDDGYNSGHDNGGTGHGPAYGHGKGHQDSGQKGRRYKYQTYESTHYDDKGGQQPTHGYAPSAPHYMQKGNGYGYSGPYPNTEYSAPIETSVDAPTGPSPNSYYDGVVDDDSPPPTLLDAADTADLIRNSIDTKENEVVRHPIGNFGGSHMSDSSHSNSDYNSVDVLPTASSVKISTSSNSRGENLPETKVNPAIGNFDLNLNYNADLPAPFRRNLFESPNERRKKISSKFRGNLNNFGSTSYSTLSQGEDSNASQSQPILSGAPGPDYLENDTGDVSGTAVHEMVKEGGPAESDKMNF